MRNYKERFYFTAKGLPEVKFYVVRFTGTEKLNAGYFFKILLLTKEHSVNPLDLIGNISIFSIAGKKGKRAVYAGPCKGVTLEDIINGCSYISVEFLPLINVLDILVQSKIYLDKTLSDLIKEIMSSAEYAPFEYEICFSQKHPAQEFSMQYNESNYNYLRYKLEEQGAYFFYSGSSNKAVLAAPEVQVAGFVFTDGQIKKAQGGNIIFGDNDIKISGVSSADKIKSDFADTLKSIADAMKKAIDEAENTSSDSSQSSDA